MTVRLHAVEPAPARICAADGCGASIDDEPPSARFCSERCRRRAAVARRVARDIAAGQAPVRHPAASGTEPDRERGRPTTKQLAGSSYPLPDELDIDEQLVWRMFRSFIYNGRPDRAVKLWARLHDPAYTGRPEPPSPEVLRQAELLGLSWDRE
jgi:hypothetical protein